MPAAACGHSGRRRAVTTNARRLCAAGACIMSPTTPQERIVMTLPDFLAEDKYGLIHVSGHRVGLVDIVSFYRQGDSAEMLHARFPTIGLPLIHKLIAFYLENQVEADGYCSRHAEEMARQRANARLGPSQEELQRRRDAARLAQGA